MIELANRLERTITPGRLSIVLDGARSKPCGLAAVHEARALERGAHGVDLVGRKHVANDDLHTLRLGFIRPTI